MFCSFRQANAKHTSYLWGVLVWYRDPKYHDYEMRPPSLNALIALRARGRYLQNIPFLLIHREVEEYSVLNGFLSKISNGFVFEDSLHIWEVSLNLEDTACNDLFRMAKRQGYSCISEEAYFLENEGPKKRVIRRVLAADEVWVSGVIQSRALVTRFVIKYISNPSLYNIQLQEGDMCSSDLTFQPPNSLLVWYPSPKPVSLKNWLSFLANKTKNDIGPVFDEQLSPFIEGYYHVVVNGISKEISEESDDNLKCTLHFVDDPASSETKAYCDFGTSPSVQHRDIGYADESERVKISSSLPLDLVCAEDLKVMEEGDWGRAGYMSVRTFFTIPFSIRWNQCLLDPVRAKPRRIVSSRRKAKSVNLKNLNSFQLSVLSGLSKDSILNMNEFSPFFKLNEYM